MKKFTYKIFMQHILFDKPLKILYMYQNKIRSLECELHAIKKNSIKVMCEMGTADIKYENIKAIRF